MTNPALPRAKTAGRVLYQMALTVTENDNGFVTMYFLFVACLSSLVSFVLSIWVSDLHLVVGPLFFIGLALVGAPLLIFSLKARNMA